MNCCSRYSSSYWESGPGIRLLEVRFPMGFNKAITALPEEDTSCQGCKVGIWKYHPFRFGIIRVEKNFAINIEHYFHEFDLMSKLHHCSLEIDGLWVLTSLHLTIVNSVRLYMSTLVLYNHLSLKQFLLSPALCTTFSTEVTDFLTKNISAGVKRRWCCRRWWRLRCL